MATMALINGEPYCLDEDYEVLEYYHFDDLSGALVDTDEAITHDRVIQSEPAFEADLRIEDEDLEDETDVATIEEIRDLQDIPAPESGASGAGIHVASTDSGIDTTHPVFEETDVRQVDVTGTGEGDRVGHGTATSGQIVRIAPGISLSMIKIFPNQESTQTKYIMRAYQWLFAHADEIDVVNMSWGAQKDSQTLDRLQNNLVGKGIRDTTAAGNTGGRGGSPATAEQAFSIGACTKDGKMAPFSSYNPDENPDVAAVGVHNRLARASGTDMGHELSENWTAGSGTSFAAPEAAGMVALYLAAVSGTDPAGVKQAFDANARNIPETPTDAHGIADYERTVETAR